LKSLFALVLFIKAEIESKSSVITFILLIWSNPHLECVISCLKISTSDCLLTYTLPTYSNTTRLSGMEGIYRDFRTKANRVDIQMILLSSKQQYLETSYSLYVCFVDVALITKNACLPLHHVCHITCHYA
jgi:hypothetical protein